MYKEKTFYWQLSTTFTTIKLLKYSTTCLKWHRTRAIVNIGHSKFYFYQQGVTITLIYNDSFTFIYFTTLEKIKVNNYSFTHTRLLISNKIQLWCTLFKRMVTLTWFNVTLLRWHMLTVFLCIYLCGILIYFSLQKLKHQVDVRSIS